MAVPNPELKLRYTFDHQTQLIRHAHLLEGDRFALFYPAKNLTAELHARAVLHVRFADTGQSLTLAGKVLSRTMGSTIEGVWLEFPEKRLLHIVASRLVVERGSPRLATDLLLRIVNATRSSSMARLLDLSSHGARVSNIPRVLVGQMVNLSLMFSRPDVPTQLGQAQVVRAAENELGLEFFRDDPLTRGAMLRLFTSAEREWKRIRELAHPALCCRNGVVLQPHLPRVREHAQQSHLG
jgi:hypothetical protein